MAGTDVTDSTLCLLNAREFYEKYEPREKLLGHGLSSVVKLCLDKRCGREVAVKMIDVTALHNMEHDADDFVKATQNEVTVLRKLAGHPNIIALYDFLSTPTHMFLVFELCPRGELFDFMNEKVTVSIRQTRKLMVQLFSAVDYIHSHKIVHRDVKPENILLDANLNIKVSDFGFAVFLEDDAPRLRELCGTPSYLAPETLNAAMYEDAPGYGREVDIWACGVVMYTLLVGFPPFYHRQQMRMLRMIMAGAYAMDEAQEWAHIPDPPKDLIRKVLIVDPSKRLTAAQALQHPFLRWCVTQQQRDGKTFVVNSNSLLSHFRVGAFVAIACRRLRENKSPGLSLHLLRSDPYRDRLARKLLDAVAFNVYGHWVKKHDVQNRAAMFEQTLKRACVVAV